MTTNKRIHKSHFTVFLIYAYNDFISYHTIIGINHNFYEIRIDINEG